MGWWDTLLDAAPAIASAYSSYSQGQAAGDAARAQVKSGDAAIAEQRRQFDLIMQMLAPQRALGNNAVNTLNRLYGYSGAPVGTGGTVGAGGTPTNAPAGPRSYGPGSGGDLAGIGQALLTGNPLAIIPALFGNNGSQQDHEDFANAIAQTLRSRGVFGPNTTAGNIGSGPGQITTGATPPTGSATPGQPDLSAFFASPDYEFRRNEGTRDINNSFAARGGALSGNALRGITDFNSNTASGEFNNFIQRQLQMAGLGGAATSQAVSAANYTGGNVANILGDQGNARASGIVDRSNAFTNGVNDLATWLGNWSKNRNGGFAGGGNYPWSAMNGGWNG